MDPSMAAAMEDDFSGSPTQANEGRSYDRFEDPESLPSFNLEDVNENENENEHEQLTGEQATTTTTTTTTNGSAGETSRLPERSLEDDDTGAVHFSSNFAALDSEALTGSDIDDGPTSERRSHFFAMAGGAEAGARAGTGTETGTETETQPGAMAGPDGLLPETPAAPRNPFGGKFQTPLLAGSQLFAQTPFSAGMRLPGSPTSSRPSPAQWDSAAMGGMSVGFPVAAVPGGGGGGGGGAGRAQGMAMMTPRGAAMGLTSSMLKPRFPTALNLVEEETPTTKRLNQLMSSTSSRLGPGMDMDVDGDEGRKDDSSGRHAVDETPVPTTVLPAPRRPEPPSSSSPLVQQQRGKTGKTGPISHYESMRESQQRRQMETSRRHRRAMTRQSRHVMDEDVDSESDGDDAYGHGMDRMDSMGSMGSMGSMDKKKDRKTDRQDDADFGSSGPDEVDDDSERSIKRRRLAQSEREQGAKMLSAISISRGTASFGEEIVEVPASTRKEYKQRQQPRRPTATTTATTTASTASTATTTTMQTPLRQQSQQSEPPSVVFVAESSLVMGSGRPDRRLRAKRPTPELISSASVPAVVPDSEGMEPEPTEQVVRQSQPRTQSGRRADIFTNSIIPETSPACFRPPKEDGDGSGRDIPRSSGQSMPTCADDVLAKGLAREAREDQDHGKDNEKDEPLGSSDTSAVSSLASTPSLPSRDMTPTTVNESDRSTKSDHLAAASKTEAAGTSVLECSSPPHPLSRRAPPSPLSSSDPQPFRRQRSTATTLFRTRAGGTQKPSPIPSGSTDELGRSPSVPSAGAEEERRVTRARSSLAARDRQTRKASVSTASLKSSTLKTSTVVSTSISTSTSTSAASGRLFAGMAFAISFQGQRADENQKACQEREKRASALQKRIQRAGGRVLEDGFDELLRMPPIHSIHGIHGKQTALSDKADKTDKAVELQPAAAQTGFTALIADGHSRKFKYMQALALGLPCLAAQWVTTCLERGRLVDWTPYLLCAGASAFLGQAIRSRSLSGLAFLADADADLAAALAQRPLLLGPACRILLALLPASGSASGSTSASASASAARKMPYVFLAQVLGAQVTCVHSAEDARHVLLAAEDAGRPFDWVYGGDETTDVFGRLAPGPAKKRKRSSGGSAAKARMPQPVSTLTNERIIQSLIFGQLITEEEMAM